MKRKPKPRQLLRLCAELPLSMFDGSPIVSSRVIVSHLKDLDVEWRLYKAEVEPGRFRWGVERMAEDASVYVGRAA